MLPGKAIAVACIAKEPTVDLSVATEICRCGPDALRSDAI